ncbi:MAG: TRAP transporter small permease [Clostridium sp.]|nr:TRAP transporter small permease [Clostridium sp.]
MKSIKWLEKNFELVILAAFLIIMSVLSFANVILRYCFHQALSWSDEVSCYCLALSAFFCLPCAIRMGSSIKVDTFTTMLPVKMQRIIEMVCNVGMIVFLVWLFKGTVIIIQNAAKIKQASPALQIPLSYLYGIMGFAVVLAILRYIQVIVKSLTKKNGEREEAE